MVIGTEGCGPEFLYVRMREKMASFLKSPSCETADTLLFLKALLLFFAKPPPNHANFGRDASRGGKRSNLAYPDETR